MEKIPIKESSFVIFWLKRIFSLQTLGIIMTAIMLWFSYDQFIKERPGYLVFSNPFNSYNQNINTIIYGFEFDSDTIDVLEQKIPVIANKTENDISDIKLLAEMPAVCGFSLSPGFRFMLEKDSSMVSFSFEKDRLGYNDVIGFPMSKIFHVKNETLYLPMRYTYIHKGLKEPDVKKIYIFAIPKAITSSEKSAQAHFISLFKPLLKNNSNTKDLAIVYKDTTIIAPNISKLENSSNFHQIIDLK